MNTNYDESKFSEMVLYAAGKLASDRFGGATKLSNVLYFADFAHVRTTGRPISGAEYQKLEHGPAPRKLIPVRRALIERGDAELRQETHLGYRTDRLVPARPADLSVFSAEELATIDSVLDDLAPLTGAQVSELSHEEPGWKLTAEGETIPYAAAIISKEHVTTPRSRALAREVAERYGLTGS